VTRQRADGKGNATQLVLVDVATRANRILVQGQKGLTLPRWSPAGDQLAFVSLATTSKGAQPEVHVQNLSGGDARVVTAASTGVQQYAWSPNGRTIAYVTADTAPNQTALDNGDDAFEVGNDNMFATAAPTPAHIWLAPSDSGDPKRLTEGSWTVASGPPIPFIAWSPDGQSIAFTQQSTPHDGDSYETKIAVVNVATGTIRDITGRTSFEGFPVYSPDGQSIAFFQPRDFDPNNVNEIAVAPASGGTARVATRGIDRSLYRAMWLPDNRSLIVGGNDGVRVSLWLQPVDGPAHRLDLGEVNPTWALFWVVADIGRDGAIAFTGTTSGHPTELYYMKSATAPVVRLTDFNQPIANLAVARADSVHWLGPNGFAEDGVLLYPPGFRPERRYPLVLWIHGGPQATSATTWDGIAQLVASHGYLVFSPNYRGSDNVGNAYQRAIVNDAGAGPARDILAGVASLVRRGFVDTTRMAATGWSYGGTMTVWLIGHSHRFVAAIAGAPLVDFIDEYALSDLNTTVGSFFGGSPWHEQLGDAYRAQSPLSYAQAIRTPTLILHDLQDQRSPPVGSFKLYHALRDNGVPVSFVIFPVPGHYPGDPIHSRDLLRRWIAWLDRYLGDKS